MFNEKPVRILHVIPDMSPGGIQSLVMNLYRHIERDRIQFDFAVRTGKPEYYEEEVVSLGGRVFRLPWMLGNPLSIFPYGFALNAILHKFGPFAGVHGHGIYSGLSVFIAKGAHVKVRLAHSHNTASSKNSFPRTMWEKTMRSLSIKNATHLLACSHAAANRLYGSNWQTDSRAKIFLNAIDLQSFASIPHSQSDLRWELSLPFDTPLIGHVGRFDEQKNHIFLVELFAKLSFRFPKAHLVLVGEGDLQSKVEALVYAKGVQDKVHFLGVRSDIPQIMNSLDLFVFPSLSEGLGIVLIEAQAAGVPCLVSDVVPDEADIKIGLVQFESLQATIEQWENKILECFKICVPPWEERKEALQAAGYDIRSAVRQIERIYLEDCKLAHDI